MLHGHCTILAMRHDIDCGRIQVLVGVANSMNAVKSRNDQSHCGYRNIPCVIQVSSDILQTSLFVQHLLLTVRA